MEWNNKIKPKVQSPLGYDQADDIGRELGVSGSYILQIADMIANGATKDDYYKYGRWEGFSDASMDEIVNNINNFIEKTRPVADITDLKNKLEKMPQAEKYIKFRTKEEPKEMPIKPIKKNN